MNHMKQKMLLSVLVAGFIAIAYTGSAAALWPDQDLTLRADAVTSEDYRGRPVTGDPSIYMLVEDDDDNNTHDERNTYFSAFGTGDTRGRPGGLTVQFIERWGGACRLPNPSVVRLSAPGTGVASVNISACGQSTGDHLADGTPVAATVTVPYGSGSYDGTRTKYQFRVQLLNPPSGRRTGYGFYVNTTAPNVTFGNTGKEPFVMIAAGDNRGFLDLAFPQQPDCSVAIGALGTIWSKDYDNYSDSRAQNRNGLQDNPSGFEQIKASWRVKDTTDPLGQAMSAHWNQREVMRQTDPSNSWWISYTPHPEWSLVEPNTYSPPDQRSNQWNAITYKVIPLTKYEYVLKDFGNRNFFRVDLPYDGSLPICNSITTPASITPVASATELDELGAPTDNSDTNITVEVGTSVAFNSSISSTATPAMAGDTYHWHISADFSAPGANVVETEAHMTDVVNATGFSYRFMAAGEYCRETYVADQPGYASVSPNPARTCVTVAAKPYFDVTGGDILSGGDIKSWNHDGIGDYNGAGSQLAALAKGDITSFVTGTGLSATEFNAGHGLAFANDSSHVVAPDTYGGGYGVTYANAAPSVPTDAFTAFGNISPAASAGGTYYRASGNVTIDGGHMQAGKHITLVVENGNVFIDGSIYYDYSGIDNIPRLTVYVQNGNISVDDDVTDIHGVFYVDHELPDDTNSRGNFITCGTSAFVSEDLNSAYGTCGHQLTVYGAVKANKLVLSRTAGSLRTGPSAERFFYSPEVWLTTSDDAAIRYNSFISLPPIL